MVGKSAQYLEYSMCCPRFGIKCLTIYNKNHVIKIYNLWNFSLWVETEINKIEYVY